MEITRILPEGCLCLIISLTSPADACRSAIVSHAFRSVADCDALWKKFLPSDYRSIISSSLLSLGKKDVYFHTDRFPEVANINLVWWIEVKGKIETRNLSPNTSYVIYLVFKLRDSHTIEFKHRTVGLHVNDDGVASWELRRVLIDPYRCEALYILDRGDGWMEVELGQFLNECRDDGTLKFSLREIDTSNFHNRGIIIEGIELRPKYISSLVDFDISVPII
ncbi:F-box protein [Gossypium australe]|uniref:F-box protein n=1 Tax=Gossypium australe TaxID=47621 RepID=A0A5B6UBT3_9ROSI|nr:F-box protein [Gossypium australe]